MNIKPTRSFRKSIKRIKKSGIDKKWLEEFELVLSCLLAGNKLDKKYKDHQLSGDFGAYRECHILYDLVLIYLVSDTDIVLVDIGSHSEIFE